ncbi:MAG: hypothetical protein AUH69_12835 [Actinobacteria bacterium 13_1_40CM_4_65_12]|nr:MAG: hypothetical protein AUH69_12835 [Actinobacteria bacterium 13_1_40CM_4_65_12]
MMLRSLALQIKQILFWLVDFTAVIHFLLNGRKPKPGLTILCYHRVAEGLPSNPPFNPFNVTPGHLERQLAALQALRGTTVVSARHVAEWLRTNRIPEGSFLLLTFDDGYQNALVAAEQLAAKGWTGVFFVVTSYVGKPILDFNDYDRWCQNLPHSKSIWYRPVELKDCHRLIALGMEVQPHSHTHRPLGWLESEEMEQEIQASRAFIEKTLGQLAVAFSYPVGSPYLNHFTPATERAMAKAGFQFAVSTEAGVNDLHSLPHQAFRMRRIPVNDYNDGLFFLAKAAGYCGILPIAKYLLHKLVLPLAHSRAAGSVLGPGTTSNPDAKENGVPRSNGPMAPRAVLARRPRIRPQPPGAGAKTL